MKYASKFLIIILAGITFMSCSENKQKSGAPADFKYAVETFADLRIQRYFVPGFEELSPKQKELVYYLYQASLAGRDIIYDQNYKHNLYIRRSLEAIIRTYSGDRTVPEFQQFMTYVKRVWFSNGIHHHYSNKKFLPEFSKEYLTKLIAGSDEFEFPLQNRETLDDLLRNISSYMFDPNVAPMKVNQADGVDLIKSSAVNFYEGVTQKEVEDFYYKVADANETEPISLGLNSRLAKENGQLIERHWKTNGVYAYAIRKIVYWLKQAVTVAENEQQKKCFELLIEYYNTGDLRKWDEYNIEWVKDTSSVVDFVNGFVETYNDPLGYRGTYESIVSIKDNEATKRIEAISKNAQWFEDNSPIAKEHKKPSVKGVSARVITAVVEAGDAAPSTPIGINLPNANWIRKEHGSKSVNLGNIVHSYNMFAATSGVLPEFAYSKEEVELEKKHGVLADDLHTDMHEVIGHASGQVNPGVAEPHQTLKNYYSTLEEARADLVALYFLYDQKLVDLGVMESLDCGKVAYNDYIRNGLVVQLARIPLGENIEEAHMRNRQLVAKWAFEMGAKENVIEKKVKDGKTYFVINDYAKLKNLFGQLLKEIQRIKSEGDLKAGKDLVENYGVKVDPVLHKEILERYKKLNIAPYAGFIQPKLVPVMQGKKIIDVKIEYPEDFTKQMLEYGKEFNLLTTYN
ncbi:MAG: dihydrofolate reductase [Melioribacteraceae bacterium]